MQTRFSLTLLGLALLPGAAYAAPYYPYTVTDLGTLPGGTITSATAVNNAGQVTGWSESADGTIQAFLSGPNGGGPLTNLGTLGGGQTEGAAVNDSGQVAGFSVVPGPGGIGTAHGFLYSGGTLTDLGANTVAEGINNAGQITGQAGNFAFLSGPNGAGPLQSLGTLPNGATSYGTAVNDLGAVTGASATAPVLPPHFNSGDYSDPHAFLFQNGAMTDLGTLGTDNESVGLAVNRSGTVVGVSETLNNERGAGPYPLNPHGFIYQNGVLSALGALPGDTFSAALGINDAGQVVGYSESPYDQLRAVLDSNGVLSDLNTLIDPASGFTLEEATGISNSGFISAVGVNNATGRQEAFLLNPVPEASSVVSLGVLLALGLGGVKMAKKGRKA